MEVRRLEFASARWSSTRASRSRCYEMGVSRMRQQLAALGPTPLQILRFSVVGGLGTATNLVLFFFLVDVGTMAPLLGAVLCFAVAVSQNYVLNELWTFATSSGGGLSLDRYRKFVAASLLGLAINAAVLTSGCITIKPATTPISTANGINP